MIKNFSEVRTVRENEHTITLVATEYESRKFILDI
jgi:hypothetical protein